MIKRLPRDGLVPDEWHKILIQVQSLDSKAVLAGGCLRDTEMGRPVKDLDIFVRDEINTNKIAAMFRAYPEINIESSTSSDEWCDAAYIIKSNALPIPLNICHVAKAGATPYDRVQHFDFGICRISYDGIRVTRESAYQLDKDERRFRLLFAPNKESFDHSMRRYIRLLLKYPDWPLYVPPQFAPYLPTP